MRKMDFDLWMTKFERLCINRIGVPTNCLPDWCFMDAWKCGDDVEDAFNDFLEFLQEEF